MQIDGEPAILAVVVAELQEIIMKKWILMSILAGVILPIQVNKARAYDMDCAIMLCMAGGFPPSAVCAAAFRVMIRRITPWPSLPPFGICTYLAVPVSLGGLGGKEDLDVSSSDYAWLKKARVLWWKSRREKERGGDILYTWTLKSCDGENRSCRYISGGYESRTPWPISIISENGQRIMTLGSSRAVMIEYSDYDGAMDHSEWFRY